jgi:glycosyltransferase involved in cell wall biosynthesis
VVIIEALASGCPVAATRVGGIEEVLQGGRFGAILANTDPGFCEDLLGAVRLASRAVVSQAMRQEIAARYTVDSLVQRVDKLYCRFLQLRGLNA